MQQFFIAIIAILGFGCWWLYSENQTLTYNNMQLEVAIDQQKEAMEAIQAAFEKQRVANDNLTRRNKEIEAEKNSYLQVFKKHDLTKLATAKPGLIETRANAATDKIFKVIEDETEPQDYDPNSTDSTD
jgi:uncharacterized membrane protein|tara:strand:- start:172 stop:558 length:387 start_codon:yes stop_codon:yes gene_type:complete